MTFSQIVDARANGRNGPKSSLDWTPPAAAKFAPMNHVLLFDIDGTLLDADGSGGAAMRRVLARDFGVNASGADIPAAGRTDAAILGDLFDQFGVPDDRRNDFVAAYIRELARVLPTRQSRLLPGALAAVRRAASLRGVGVGLLTGNLRRAAAVKLDHHGIGDYFEFGAFGDSERDRNRVAAEAASMIAEAGGPPPECVWVIGDTPADVECARSAGFRVLAVATGMFDADALAVCEPDLLAESLTEAHLLFAALA